MKTSGKCMVAIENKKGDMYMVNLDANGQAFVLQALSQYLGGTLEVNKDKLPLTLITNT
jgi:hypothetical protein